MLTVLASSYLGKGVQFISIFEMGTTIGWSLSLQTRLIYFRRDLQINVVSETYSVCGEGLLFFTIVEASSNLWVALHIQTHKQTQTYTHTKTSYLKWKLKPMNKNKAC